VASEHIMAKVIEDAQMWYVQLSCQARIPTRIHH